MKKNELFSKTYRLFTEDEDKDDIYTISLNDEEYGGLYKIEILAIYQAITIFLDIDKETKKYTIHKLFCQNAMDENYKRLNYPIERLKENYTDLANFIDSFILNYN